MHAPRAMITFESEGIRFNNRVGGILILNQHILFQTSSEEDFFILPGGRAELGETASASLLREMQEELGVSMKIERLLYIVENFYTEPDDSWHELGFYFLMTAPGDSYLNQSLETFDRVDEAGYHLRFEWLPIAQLDTFPIMPPIFRKALKDIPDCTILIEEHSSRFEE